MPANTARGFPYPLGTDPLSQGDDTIHSLASYLDANVPKYGDATDPNFAKAWRSLTTSIPNAGTALMSWDQKAWDPTNIIGVGAVTRITFAVAGRYLVVMSLGFTANATGYRQALVLLNGTTSILRVQQMAANGATHVMGGSIEYGFAVNDYIELQGGQNSGAALTTTGGIDMTSMSVRRIGP